MGRKRHPDGNRCQTGGKDPQSGLLCGDALLYIEKWRSEYGFSIDIICAACQQTIQSIHQPSFPYTDKMLSNWRKLNVHTMEDVKRLNLEHKERTKASAQEAAGPKNKFTSIGQRSYEYDELEKMLLTTNSKH